MRLRIPFPATVLALALSSAAVVLTKDASWAEALHRYLSVRGRGLSGPLWFFSAWLVIAELHALLHESAHAVTGLALELPVTSITAAGLRLHRENRRSRRWRLGLSEEEMPFLGGSTYVEHQAGSTLRLIATTAAGPVMSFVLFVALVAVIVPMNRGYLDPLRLFLTIAAAHCGWNTFHNSLPILVRGKAASFFARRTDGATIVELLSLHRFVKANPAAGRLREWAVSGRRLRECPVTVDEAVEAMPEDLRRHSEFLIFALVRCLDSRAWPQAKQIIDRGIQALDDLSDWARSDVLVQGTCLYALVEKDLARAKELLELAKEHEVGPRYARIAETGVLFAEGKFEDVKRELEHFIEDAKKARWPHLVLAGNEWSIDLMAPGKVEELKKTTPFSVVSAE